jgi:hypothetical protein
MARLLEEGVIIVVAWARVSDLMIVETSRFQEA